MRFSFVSEGGRLQTEKKRRGGDFHLDEGRVQRTSPRECEHDFDDDPNGLRTTSFLILLGFFALAIEFNLFSFSFVSCISALLLVDIEAKKTMETFLTPGVCDPATLFPQCDAGATCTDVGNSSHACVCDDPETPSDGCYMPVDECALGTHTCSDQASCHDELEGYTCECWEGYYGDGHRCFWELCTELWRCSGNSTVCVVDSGSTSHTSDDSGLCLCRDPNDVDCRRTLASENLTNDCLASSNGGADICGTGYTCTVKLDDQGVDQGLYHCACAGLPFTCPDTVIFYAVGLVCMVALITATLLTVRNRRQVATGKDAADEVPYVDDMDELNDVCAGSDEEAADLEHATVAVLPVSTGRGAWTASASVVRTRSGGSASGEGGGRADDSHDSATRRGVAPSVPLRQDLLEAAPANSNNDGIVYNDEDLRYQEQQAQELEEWRRQQRQQQVRPSRGRAASDASATAVVVDIEGPHARSTPTYGLSRKAPVAKASTTATLLSDVSGNSRAGRRRPEDVDDGLEETAMGLRQGDLSKSVDASTGKPSRARSSSTSASPSKTERRRRRRSKSRGRNRSRSRSRRSKTVLESCSDSDSPCVSRSGSLRDDSEVNPASAAVAKTAVGSRQDRRSQDVFGGHGDAADHAAVVADALGSLTGYAADAPVRVGDRVLVNSFQRGVVKYVGPLDGLPLGGLTFVGVLLDLPEGSGDGFFGGRKYFDAPPLHSVFVGAESVELDNSPVSSQQSYDDSSSGDSPQDASERKSGFHPNNSNSASDVGERGDGENSSGDAVRRRPCNALLHMRVQEGWTDDGVEAGAGSSDSPHTPLPDARTDERHEILLSGGDINW